MRARGDWNRGVRRAGLQNWACKNGLAKPGLQNWACNAGDMVSDVVLNTKTHKAISSTIRICRLLRRKFEMFT